MIKIGITGGMGSGKSVLSELFRLYDIPVFDADKVAKQLNDTSPEIREALSLHFGADLYSSGKLDRRKLAAIIFHDRQKRALANAIIHPVLADTFIKWCSERVAYPYLVLDAALLIEAGFHHYVDQVITVWSPREMRIKRVMQRDHTDRDAVEARMRSQMAEEEKIKMANTVIYNDNHHSLIEQCADYLESLSQFGTTYQTR